MNYQSKLGYSKGSPYGKGRVNTIQADGIDMRKTEKPLLAVNRKGAAMLSPGGYYPGIKGSTTEIPVETLLELEPLLLEIHLSSLKGDKKEEFMDKYGVLGTSMKVAALSQIMAKHPEVGQQLQQVESQGNMQDGGQISFLGNLPKYEPESRSTLDTRPQPVQGLNYNAMFLNFALPATNEAQRLDKMGRYDEASSLRSDVMTANQFRQDMEAEQSRKPASMKKGGKTHSLTPEKAREILHDGTVHGKPITEKQRKFFGAVASGKAKMQSGGKSWSYQAPPVEGMVLSGIESNRPKKENLPPQGTRKTLTKPSSGNMASVQQSTPEEEAFWAKMRELNKNRALQVSQAPSAQTVPQVSATSATIANFVGREAAVVLSPLRHTWSATDLQRSGTVYGYDQYGETPLLTEDALKNRYAPKQEFIPLLTEEALLKKRLGRSQKASVK